MDEARADRRDPRAAASGPSSAVFAALAPEGAEDAKSQDGRSPRCSRCSGASDVRRRARRPLHQRPRPRQHPEGRHVLGRPAACTAASPPPTQLRRIADVAEKYDVPMVKLTGGQRIDLLGIRKEDLPERLGRPRHARRATRTRKAFRTVQDLRRHSEFCRFGHGRLDRPRHRAREAARRASRVPAKMKLAVSGCPRNCAEAYGQGRRRGRDRGRRVGDLRRRRRGRARPQGRPALHASTTQDEVLTRHRPVPAVLPRERQVARAHLRLRPADRHRDDPRHRRRRQRGHRRAPRRGRPAPRRHLRRPVAAGQGAAVSRAVPTSLPLEVLPHVPSDRAESLLEARGDGHDADRHR